MSIKFKVKKAREYESYPKVFTESKETIKRWFGLEISIIEQHHLKRIINKTMDDFDLIGNNLWSHCYSGYGMSEEATARFMNEIYGLPMELAGVYMIHLADGLNGETIDLDPLKKIYTKDPKKFKEYMRMQQEKAHLP